MKGLKSHRPNRLSIHSLNKIELASLMATIVYGNSLSEFAAIGFVFKQFVCSAN